MRFVLYVSLMPHLVLVEKVFLSADSAFGEAPKDFDKKHREKFMTWMRPTRHVACAAAGMIS